MQISWKALSHVEKNQASLHTVGGQSIGCSSKPIAFDVSVLLFQNFAIYSALLITTVIYSKKIGGGLKNKNKCTLADGFQLWEKIWAQSSFVLMGIIGFVGISLVDWRWALLYLFIYLYGIMGIVMRHLVCPRCPHLHVYNDCLQAPKKFTLWIVKKQKTEPLSAFEKFLFYTYFILIPTYPIYWLISNKLLLISFLLMVVMWYAGQFLYFCKRCRVYDCPFNRVTLTH